MRFKGALPHEKSFFVRSTPSFPPTLNRSLLRTATSFISFGAGEELSVRYRERRRCFLRHTGGVMCRLNTPIACCSLTYKGRVERSLRFQAKREVL
jgi:hypothetical protein